METEYACLDFKPQTIVATSTTSAAPEKVSQPPWALIAVLLLFALVLIYFVFGTLLRSAMFKKEGLDAVPHAGLWRAIGHEVRSVAA